MLTEKYLEKALTGMLSETVLQQGQIFFASLRSSKLCSEEEIAALEEEWRELIEKRRSESTGAAESLSSLMGKLQTLHATTKPDDGEAG